MFILREWDPDDLPVKARYSLPQRELCFSRQTLAMPQDRSTKTAMADLLHEIDEHCLVSKSAFNDLCEVCQSSLMAQCKGLGKRSRRNR